MNPEEAHYYLYQRKTPNERSDAFDLSQLRSQSNGHSSIITIPHTSYQLFQPMSLLPGIINPPEQLVRYMSVITSEHSYAPPVASNHFIDQRKLFLLANELNKKFENVADIIFESIIDSIMDKFVTLVMNRFERIFDSVVDSLIDSYVKSAVYSFESSFLQMDESRRHFFHEPIRPLIHITELRIERPAFDFAISGLWNFVIEKQNETSGN